MNSSQESVLRTFGHRLRIRVCGLLLQDNQILLIKHQHMGPTGELWVPPGGGMQFGESAEEALRREFLEETGLRIKVGKLAFTHEFLEPPLHAIELFFFVSAEGGDLQLGKDPEMAEQDQLIKEVKYLPLAQLQSINRHSLHHILQDVEKIEDLEQRAKYTLNGK